MRVLVVDDDVVSRMVLMHLVDSCGAHEIVEAEDGAAAWELLDGGLRPDLCFCDLRMPRLSGMELLQKVRADSTLAAMPLVLVSSANDQETLHDAQQAGVSGYIVKPFQQEQVREQLDAFAGAGASKAAALSAEPPWQTLQRLGIERERLQAYLDGFRAQIQAAGDDIESLLASGEPLQARQRIERLHLGCTTLGLHGATAELAVLLQGAALDGRHLHAVLAALEQSVLHQVQLLRSAQ